MGSSSSPALVAMLALAAGSLMACTGTVVASEADADTASMHALLVVEQSMPATSDETAKSLASVWFLRASDDETATEATRLVTDVLELPRDGECVFLGAPPSPEIPSAMSPVELAFAGDVHVLVGESRTDLAVRAFPDVGGLVSGVVYTARRQTVLDLASDNRVRVSVSGANEINGFEALTEAPAPPSGVAIDGVSTSTAELAVRRGRAFSLTWTPGRGSDLMYIDLAPIPGSAQDRVRCASSDSGRMQVPAMAVPETETMSITLHRVRDASLRSDTGDAGAAHFDLAVTARVAIANP